MLASACTAHTLRYSGALPTNITCYEKELEVEGGRDFVLHVLNYFMSSCCMWPVLIADLAEDYQSHHGA